MRWTVWKAIGVAGLAGVAAGGAVLARNERARRAYTPEQVRARLHERVAEATTAAGTKAGTAAGAEPGTEDGGDLRR